MAMHAPLGFRFHPTENELINYLRKRVHNEELPSNAVIDGNLYGPNADLPDVGRNGRDAQEMYIFTRITKRGKRMKRLGGDGYWKVKGKMKEVKNAAGERVGYKQSLVYKNPSKSRRMKNLIMDEYVLVDYGNFDEWSLCRVKLGTKSYDASGSSLAENFWPAENIIPDGDRLSAENFDDAVLTSGTHEETIHPFQYEIGDDITVRQEQPFDQSMYDSIYNELRELLNINDDNAVSEG